MRLLSCRGIKSFGSHIDDDSNRVRSHIASWLAGLESERSRCEVIALNQSGREGIIHCICLESLDLDVVVVGQRGFVSD